MNCLLVLLTGECFYFGPGLTVLRSASIVFKKNCPLCYKHVIKVGIHEGTSRRDLFQGLVRCRVYTMGQVAGISPLKGLHAGTCYTSKY